MCVGNKEMHMGQLQAGIIPVTPFQQNCTILFDAETKAGVVVDPGGEIERIVQTLEDNGIAAGAIRIVAPSCVRPRDRWPAAHGRGRNCQQRLSCHPVCTALNAQNNSNVAES